MRYEFCIVTYDRSEKTVEMFAYNEDKYKPFYPNRKTINVDGVTIDLDKLEVQLEKQGLLVVDKKDITPEPKVNNGVTVIHEPMSSEPEFDIYGDYETTIGEELLVIIKILHKVLIDHPEVFDSMVDNEFNLYGLDDVKEYFNNMNINTRNTIIVMICKLITGLHIGDTTYHHCFNYNNMINWLKNRKDS